MKPPGELMTIGTVARLGGVSVKAIRLYSDLGLLQPIIKPHSRYRLYSLAQLSVLHRILVLKSLGIPLAQVPGELSGFDERRLAVIRDRLTGQLEDIQRQLAWVEGEIRSGRQDGGLRNSGIVTKRLAGLKVCARRVRIDRYDQADVVLHELAGQLSPSSRVVAGVIWHDCGHQTRTIDCEPFWALSRNVRGARELAPTLAASILHEGDESTIARAYDAARKWITDHRFTIVGPTREIYLRSAGLHQGRALTEIQFPIARRA